MAHVHGIWDPSLAAYFVGVDTPPGIATRIIYEAGWEGYLVEDR